MKQIKNTNTKPHTTLLLFRTYHPKGVNGRLYLDNTLLCYTIELPWLDNRPSISCIPEGTYRIIKRWSQRFKWHLQILDVPGRYYILIHPANDALKELRGCIAPVSAHSGIGKGVQSKLSMEKLMHLCSQLEKTGKLFLTIKKK